MRFLLAMVMVSFLGCAHTKPQVVEQPKCPECPECQLCDKVEIGSCYHMLGLTVFFPVYDEVTGELKEVIPVPSIEPGCYCRVMVNDFPMLTSFPVDDSFCQGDEDESELDGQGSTEETPPEGTGGVGRIPEVESPHSN